MNLESPLWRRCYLHLRWYFLKPLTIDTGLDQVEVKGKGLMDTHWLLSRGWDLFSFLLLFRWNKYDVFVMRNIKEEKLDWRTQWTQWLLSRGLSLFSFCFFCNKFHVSCHGKYALSLSSVFASAIYMMLFAMGNTLHIDYHQRTSPQDVLDPI